MNERNVVTELFKVADDMRGNENRMVFVPCEVTEHLHHFITNHGIKACRCLIQDKQLCVMRQIADYIIVEGTVSISELNSFDPELWKKAIINFGAPALKSEIIELSKFILKAA